MNKLEELIKEFCPNGVDYKKLNEVCTFNRGTSITSKDANEGNIPVISGGQKPAFYHNVSNRPANTITVAGSGAYAGYVAIWDKPIFCADSFSVDIINEEQLNKRYLYHYLLSKQSEIFAKKQGAGIPHVHGKDIASLQIPLPALPVQREIVRILDSFTLYSAELTAELTARRKQYEFYRDKLLNFESNTKLKKFGDVATIVRGASPRPIQMFLTDSSEGVNWIKIGDVEVGSKYITKTKEKITKEGANKSRYVKRGDFILSNSMSFGRPYILKIDGCIHDGWLAISDYEKYFISDFLYYLLNSSSIQRTMAQKASFGGAVQNLNADIVRGIELPIPPMEVQERIVKVLDNFDAICSDLGIGLPAEMEKRQQQYEYYRDKLLTFDTKSATIFRQTDRQG